MEGITRDYGAELIIQLYINEEDYDAIEAFLAEGLVDPNDCGPDKSNPLVIAIEENDIYMIELLIKYGADVNFVGPKGIRPLHFAVLNNSIDIVILLIANGAYIDALYINDFGESITALNIATRLRYAEIIEILEENRENLSYKSN